jgi:hypothetical protein
MTSETITFDEQMRLEGRSPKAVREVISSCPPHERRIVEVHGGWIGAQESKILYQYCTACAHYQAGDYAKLAVAWVEHINDANGANQ